MQKKTQLIGISNAIVDILSKVNYDFLVDINAEPGSMNLIDASEADLLYQKLTKTKEMSGGSVANTIACFSNFGGDAGYIGQVKNDKFGNVFIEDMKSMGVDVRLETSTIGSPTAKSHILITEDGQRTMQTYLGACTELSSEDVNSKTIGETDIILLEGYLWDIPDINAIAERIVKIKNKSSVRIALSLSDSFCVERHHKAFSEIVNDMVDIIFANEEEMMTLTDSDSYDDMIKKALKLNKISVITLGEKGSVIINKSDVIQSNAIETKNIIDTTGAGDTFTAAFLFGFISGKSIKECAELGSWSASKVIQQIGARLDKNTLKNCPLI